MNTILKIFDNIGFKFTLQDNQFEFYKQLNSFSKLDKDHIGYYIPYLARNIKDNQWEVGVGLVTYGSGGDVVVVRNRVINSSNNNNFVNFVNADNCEFYLFANQSNFDTGFANTVVIDKSITAYNTKALYLVDCSEQDITIILPPEPLDNLEVEVKIVGGYNNVTIREYNGHVLSVLNSSFNYNKLVYHKEWYALYNQDKINTLSALSQDSPIFSTLSVPGGNAYSFQYNDGANNFAGADFYLSSGNNSLLLGADSEDLAHTIIPISGSGNTIFNNDRNLSDFIVYGSGTKNLFFTYDGRLGLNIPSGSRPTTIFHVVNTICQEGFRLENRNVCHPANMTLYHKPNGSLSNNTQVSQINLSAKNTDGNKIDYAQINAYALSTTSLSEKGYIDFTVASGSNDLAVFSADPEQLVVGYSGVNNLTVNRNGITTLGYSSSVIGVSSTAIAASSTSLTFNGSSVSLQANALTLGSGGSSVTVQGTANIGTIQSSNINMPSISPSSILSIGSSNQISALSGLSTNSYGTLNFNAIPSGKFLTTTQNGAVTGIYNLDDYFYTDADILWNKFDKRSATICLKQLTFDETVPITEFAVGDQIAIEAVGSTTQYRFIESLDISGSNIVGMILDQTVTNTTTSDFNIYSITQGGYLSIGRYVEPGIVTDASDIILSLRPETATEFNTGKKNIDFIVHGSEEQPALYIKAHSDQPVAKSGYYHLFATKDDNIFSMIVTTGGVGLNNQYSSANYGRDAASNLFSGLLSDVGSNGLSSYYGTFDQNGNVAEWVEKSITDMSDAQEIVAGGSVHTSGNSEADGVAPTGLRSIEFLNRSGCYDYVGFRVASIYNTTDFTNVSSPTGLNISFVSVIDTDNISDSRELYLKTHNETSGEAEYSLASLSNLGRTDSFYRISKYEITNAQYIQFLKAVATIDDRNLYDSRMSSDVMGGIDQIELGPSDYDYSLKDNMANKPVNFVNFISTIRFINWMHNGASSSVEESYVDQTIDTGAYNVIPNGVDTYIISKQRYRKYWLPSIDQWHKAAYFEPINISAGSGVSTIMIRRNEPHIVSTDVNDIPNYASVSISGWLYVDHLIVGDNLTASSSIPTIDFDTVTKTCTSNANCGHCGVCVDNVCVQSTDSCCVAGCCRNWDSINEVCTDCQGCTDITENVDTGSGDSGSGSSNVIPCPPFC
jgi:formylglycine-generating enzyme required for sulfatase activity